MKIEKLKENATPREQLAWLEKCLTHAENGGEVYHTASNGNISIKNITSAMPEFLEIHHEEPEHYVPYDDTTAHLIPYNPWVRRNSSIHIDQLIRGIKRNTGEIFIENEWQRLDPKEWSYCNSPVNGDLAGKPFGVEKEVV